MDKRLPYMNLSAMQETQVRFLGQGNPLQSMWLQRIEQDWATDASTSTYIYTTNINSF